MTLRANCSNRKGINRALDMVEKSIMELERKAKSRMKGSNTFEENFDKERISHIDSDEKIIKKSKEPKKKKLASVLLNKRISNISNQPKQNKATVKKTNKIGNSLVVSRRRASDKKLATSKTKNGRQIKPNDRLHYANPTLSYELRGELCKEDKEGKQATIPFIVEAGQSKSHNLRVIIQQNLNKQKLLPPARTGNIKQDVSREDIGQALINVEKELKVIKKYNLS